jgi:hypothetical protein
VTAPSSTRLFFETDVRSAEEPATPRRMTFPKLAFLVAAALVPACNSSATTSSSGACCSVPPSSSGEGSAPGSGASSGTGSGVVPGSGSGGEQGGGVCDGSCSGSCVGGGCLVTLAAIDNAIGQTVVVGGSEVYWLSSGATSLGGGVTTAISAVGTHGGAVSTIYSGQAVIAAMAAESNHVYWAVDPAGSAAEGTILQGSVDGLTATLVTGLQYVDVMAVNAADVFWSSSETLYRAPLSGGTATSLVPLVSEGSLLASANELYWLGYGIESLPTAGGTPVTLVPDMTYSLGNGLALEGTDLYFDENNALFKVPVAGGTPVSLAAVDDLVSIVPTSSQLYAETLVYVSVGDGEFATRGALVAVPTGGGAPRTVTTGLYDVGSISTDGQSLYFATQRVDRAIGGAIMKFTESCGCPAVTPTDGGADAGVMATPCHPAYDCAAAIPASCFDFPLVGEDGGDGSDGVCDLWCGFSEGSCRVTQGDAGTPELECDSLSGPCNP